MKMSSWTVIRKIFAFIQKILRAYCGLEWTEETIILPSWDFLVAQSPSPTQWSLVTREEEMEWGWGGGRGLPLLGCSHCWAVGRLWHLRLGKRDLAGYLPGYLKFLTKQERPPMSPGPEIHPLTSFLPFPAKHKMKMKGAGHFLLGAFPRAEFQGGCSHLYPKVSIRRLGSLCELYW
jgi:hypothetical protein